MTNSASPETTPLLLIAPLSGCPLPLERVPDPVFAQKMVGDGISLDPLSQCLLAPCDGTVAQLHSAGHAVTIKTAQGIEIMMHIGLDTVDLKGQGFSPKAKIGDSVKAGDALIEFDADYVATHAKSLLTQIVITNSERVAEFRPHLDAVTAGEDVLMELILTGGIETEETGVGSSIVSEAILIPNPTGLHARPAAVLANVAKKFKADIQLQRGEDRANAKSVVAIMGLEVSYGDKVNLQALGPDAEAAIAELTPLLQAGLGDEGAKAAPAPASMTLPDNAAPAPRSRSSDPNVLLGVAASPGLAVGHVFQVRREELTVPEHGDNPYRERRQLDQAIETAKLQLEALQTRLHAEADAGKAAIFAAHQELLEDPDLLDIADSAIAKGKSAAFSWQQAYTLHAERLAGLRNELLAARANDLRDVGLRVLRLLLGVTAEEPEMPAETILVAEDLTPSDTASLDRSRVLGFCTTAGGASSHVAILARSLDIPAAAGIDPRALSLADGSSVILDGGKGIVRLNPSATEIDRIRQRQQRLAEKRQIDLAHAMEPANTTDDKRVEVVANIGGVADAEQAVALGGEGVGLLRSEFLFLERATAPSEEEQVQVYSQILGVLGPERLLIVRTLDVGGDKPLPYLPIPREDNPFLGERGIRVSLDRPELFRTQLRAILRASQNGKVSVMFPMISTLGDLRAAKAILEEERNRLGCEPIMVGIMVEVPAVAVMAEQFAKEVDFFSIGTNDLTQYTLAMDRGHPKLAPAVDGLNPSVLQLIASTVEAAHHHRCWVGVCGGIASDPQAVPILLGLGVDELSVSVPTIPSIKAQIRSLSLAGCCDLAHAAMGKDTAAEVRALYPDPLAEPDDADDGVNTATAPNNPSFPGASHE